MGGTSLGEREEKKQKLLWRVPIATPRRETGPHRGRGGQETEKAREWAVLETPKPVKWALRWTVPCAMSSQPCLETVT